MELKDARVLVTGASSGIGRSCAAKFAEAGAKLLITARRRDRIDVLAGELKGKYHADCLTMELDIRDRKTVEKAFANLPKERETIDILVNNAGLSRGLGKLREGNMDA